MSTGERDAGLTLDEAWRAVEETPGWALKEVMRRANSGPDQYAAIGCPLRDDGTWLNSKSLNGFGVTPTAALVDLMEKIATVKWKSESR